MLLVLLLWMYEWMNDESILSKHIPICVDDLWNLSWWGEIVWTILRVTLIYSHVAYKIGEKCNNSCKICVSVFELVTLTGH